MRPSSYLNVLAFSGRHAPLNTSRLSLGGRDSWVLSWSVDGQLFEGEASPLAGFGFDSGERCRQDLAALDSTLLAALSDASNAAEHPLEALRSASPDFGSPAARFAFEACILGRVAFLRHVPLWSLLATHGGDGIARPATLEASAVLDPAWTDWDGRVDALFGRGIRTFKLKVGRDLGHELSCLRSLSARFGPALRVRIDPNQNWTGHDLAMLAREHFEFELEWLEDPTIEADAWRALESPVPLAADEILIGQEPSAEFLDLLDARFVVLKPMALGGYLACLDWARVARTSGRGVSVSHLFDGPRALDACIQLAFAIQTPGITPGLGLHVGLDGWDESPRYAWAGRLLRPEFGP